MEVGRGESGNVKKTARRERKVTDRVFTRPAKLRVKGKKSSTTDIKLLKSYLYSRVHKLTH